MNKEFKVAIIYWSKTGNTEKVAFSIQDGLEEAGAKVEMMKVKDAENVDFLAYDLVCIGTPSYQWCPPQKLEDYLKDKFSYYEDQGYVKLGAPKVKGRNVLLFCTYSGPHTGKNEAIPVLKYIGQFFEHLGFEIVGEWYTLSEFHGKESISTQGRMGDIRGLPSEKGLEKIKNKSCKLVNNINK